MRKIKPKQDSYMVGLGKGMGMKPEQSKPVYPKIRMDIEHISEAKKMKLGEEAHLHLHTKLAGIDQHSAEFEVHGIEHKKKGHDQIDLMNEEEENA